MITLLVVPLVLTFSPAAVWALRAGGLRLLWLLCALALVTVIFLALLLCVAFSVPSAWRIVSYSLAFVGPSILCATGSLTLAKDFARTLPLQLVVAFAGSMIGLAVGMSAVVFALGIW